MNKIDDNIELEALLVQNQNNADTTNELLDTIIQQNEKNNLEPVLDTIVVQNEKINNSINEGNKEIIETIKSTSSQTIVLQDNKELKQLLKDLIEETKKQCEIELTLE